MTGKALLWYVYCIAPAGNLPTLDGLAGVDPSFGLGCVAQDELCAVISRVQPNDFAAEPLKRNLEDLAWLARVARTHDAVLAHVLAGDAVVPLRLCTIFANEEGVRTMLRRQRESLRAALTCVRGRTEWSVKLQADPQVVQDAVVRRASALEGAAARSEGRAFFARKRLERAAQDDARALIAQAAEATHSRLCERAAAAITLPPQNRQLSGRSGEMVLNGAYLIERATAPEFAALVTELGARHRDNGLTLELNGPFAPYNFVPSGTQSA